MNDADRWIDPNYADKCSLAIDWNNIVRVMREHPGTRKYAELVAGRTERGTDLVVRVTVFNLPEMQ